MVAIAALGRARVGRGMGTAMSSISSWYCPLYKHDIAAGRCLDINNERMRFFQTGMYQEVTEETGIQEPEITATCINCPNQPLKEELPTPGSREA
jgi:hypothetical protein